MLIALPTFGDETLGRLDELDELRRGLAKSVGQPSPWIGALRRFVRATSAESSISIEGFHVPEDEVAALANREEAADLSDENRVALTCYARAMDHVGIMASDPSFRWLDRVILDLHFDACLFQRDKSPGGWRTGPVRIVDSTGGIVYEAPDADRVPGLMAEVVEWLQNGDLEAHVVVRAAMAHLHVISVHPFQDGNGRVSRIVQSLVLARDGLVSPEFGSIEEYLAGNTPAYYAALQSAQGPHYEPAESNASRWIDFCVDAHLTQARRRLAQIEEAATRWDGIEGLVEERGWPERLMIALERSLIGGADRAGYCAEAGISGPTASGDFRRLLDAGLVVQEGRGPSTRYLASPALRTRVSSD